MHNTSLVLIYPDSVWGGSKDGYRFTTGLPLPLLYLSGSVRELCPDIHIFDCNLKDNDDSALTKLLQRVRPDIVGINCMFSGNFPKVRTLAATIKKDYPESKIILGGIHPTIFAKEIMENCGFIDAIVLGEADRSFPALIEYFSAVQDGKTARNQPPPSHIDGLAIRLDGKIFFSEKKHYIENLDTLPMPGYEYFDCSRYRIDTSTMFNPKGLQISEVLMPLLTSRSCPNQCYFCGMRLVMGNRFRMRSAEHVFAEIKYLYDIHGINYFTIADDNFTFNKKRTLDLCSLIIKNKLQIYLSFPTGLMVRTLDDEVVAALCEAGGIRFNLAIESGNDSIRNKIIRKNCSKEKIHTVIRSLRNYNVLIAAFFMIGFPEDTNETLQDTLNLVDELDIDIVHMNKVNPLPGTSLFAQCHKDKLFTETVDLSTWWQGEHTMIKSVMSGGGGGNFFIKPYALSMDTLFEWDSRINKSIQQKSSKRVLQHLKNKRKAIGGSV